MVPKIMLTKRKTAGIRMPDNRICLELAEGVGHAIISTSATKNDGTVLDDPSLIHDYFASRIDMVIDGGPVPGKPSSVIDMMGDYPKIIREGQGNIDLFK